MMDIPLLEAFAAVITTGSLTGAGKALGRSQPTISRQIQQLEIELGCPLFVRNGPRVQPMDAAFQLYGDVESTLAGLRRIQRQASRLGRAQGDSLQLLATPALAAGLVPAALKRLDTDRPGLEASLHSAPAEQVLQQVVGGSARLGVSSLPLEHSGVDIHWIGQAPCVVAVAADDPLATEPRIALDAFRQRRLITLENPYRIGQRWERALASARVTPLGRLETNTSVSALALARQGLGMALLEPVSAHGLPLEGVVIRPLDVDLPYLFGVISSPGHALGAAALAFVDQLADCAASLLPGFVKHRAEDHAALLQQLQGKDTRP